MKALIDSGNLELIQVLLEKTDFVTKKNIDKFIQYAIDTKQQEIYLTLIHYKDEIGAYTDISKKFRLAGSLSLPEIHRNITALSGSLTLPHGTD